ncbi:MAG: plasmid partition protein ParG [archaeon]
MSEKAKTSLTLKKELWKKFKLKCVEKEKSYTEILESLIEDWLKKQ